MLQGFTPQNRQAWYKATATSQPNWAAKWRLAGTIICIVNWRCKLSLRLPRFLCERGTLKGTFIVHLGSDRFVQDSCIIASNHVCCAAGKS